MSGTISTRSGLAKRTLRGAAAVLATIPLARAAAAVQLLGLTIVMVLMLVAEEDARRRKSRGARSHGESITH